MGKCRGKCLANLATLFVHFFRKKFGELIDQPKEIVSLLIFICIILVWRIKEIKDDRDSPNSTSFPAMMVAKILDEQLVIPMTRRMQILQLEST